jgi:hypothetical protein
MRYQTNSNYQPLKLSWRARIAPLIFLAGAAIGSFSLGALEGAVEGWNYESMEKQALLTKKFEKKFQEAQGRHEQYSINREPIKNYLNKNVR